MNTYYAEEGLWTGYVDPMRNVRNSTADPDEKVTLGTRRCLIPRKPLSLWEGALRPRGLECIGATVVASTCSFSALRRKDVMSSNERSDGHH